MGKRANLCTGEKIIYNIAITCFILTLVIKTFAGAKVGNMSMTVERLRYEVAQQEKMNECLTMKVNELTSFDKIKDTVKEMGLAYNNDNIIIIND